jgi:hypothetical protein
VARARLGDTKTMGTVGTIEMVAAAIDCCIADRVDSMMAMGMRMHRSCRSSIALINQLGT